MRAWRIGIAVGLLALTFGLMLSWMSLQRYSPLIQDQPGKDIYVVSHGWHTGIVLSVQDNPGDALPERRHFFNVRYLEFGWGDAGFYQARDISAGLAAEALLLPTPSVMHVVGFRKDVADYFRWSTVRKLRLSTENHRHLVTAIANSFDRGGERVVMPLRKGIYGSSYFYPAQPPYHALRTCNNWTALMLNAAQVPVSNWLSSSAPGLMWQLNALPKS